MDAANNDVVSFIVTSEWDQDPENWDMFNGLDCENMNNFPPRKRSVPALKKTCSSTPIKDWVLTDVADNDVVSPIATPRLWNTLPDRTRSIPYILSLNEFRDKNTTFRDFLFITLIEFIFFVCTCINLF